MLRSITASARRLAAPLVVLASLLPVPAARGLSTDRAGNLFASGEDIVLKTTATGTAAWLLTNDYGDRIEGRTPVVDGVLRIPTDGLRYGRYTFEVARDGKVVGGIVPPVIDLPPDLGTMVFAPFQEHWQNPEEALMWRQIGFWELRYEYGLSGFNPRQGQHVYDPDIERYFQALADNGVRMSFKINGPPRWNDSSTVEGKESEPRDYAAWEETLATYAAHYRPFGLDRYYVVNEPEAGGWWAGGWDGYYRFLESTNRTLKRVDPSILSIAPESWSYVPQFMDTVLRSGAVDVVSGHYPVDEQAGNVHSAFYFERMRRTGTWKPFINGEDFYVWPGNLDQADWRKNYPGIVGGVTGGSLALTLLYAVDMNAYRVVALHLMTNRSPLPFEAYEPGNVVPTEQLFQNRAVNDELAGAQFLGRVPGSPPNVAAWLYRRGSDRYLAAFVPVGRMTQLLEITTSAPRLRVVDCFGNEGTLEPADGKARLLLTNLECYVHGLQEGDTFSFIPRDRNEPPQIAPAEGLVAVAGRPFRARLSGLDPDATIMDRRLPTWSLPQPPEGMRIHRNTGVLEWTPAEAGEVAVTATLTDADGAAAERAIRIDVRPAGTNLSPAFVSRSTPVAVVGGTYRYRPQAIDPEGGEVRYAVDGPDGMAVRDGVITWTAPATPGEHAVRVTATDADGAAAEQAFTVVVCPNPDHPERSDWPPRIPSRLTVVDSAARGVTLVWNRRSPGVTVVQRAASADGPWQEVGQSDATWFTDADAPADTAFYRVLARNAAGDSEPTPAVNGRNRAPRADAGASLELAGPGAAELDGSRSSDPEGRPLTYQWRVVCAPDPAAVRLENPTEAICRLAAAHRGKYLVGLRVSDGVQVSEEDFAWVTVGLAEMERVADAGPARTVRVGQRVTLALSGSPATKQDNWFSRWHELPFDSYPRMADTKTTAPSFTPEVPGVYEAMVFPIDEWMYGFPDFATVIVVPEGVPAE